MLGAPQFQNLTPRRNLHDKQFERSTTGACQSRSDDQPQTKSRRKKLEANWLSRFAAGEAKIAAVRAFHRGRWRERGAIRVCAAACA